MWKFFSFKSIFFNHLLGIAIVLSVFSMGAFGKDIRSGSAGEILKISTFDIDVTPPVGTVLAYGPAANSWDLGLRARGVVLLGVGKPVILCSIDWIGIGNEGHDAFCEELAKAAGTTPDRVAVHTVHQHDTPVCDFGAEKILKDAGKDPARYQGAFGREVLQSLSAAVKKSLAGSVAVTHIGWGSAEVFKVASNRRILGKDGKVRADRLSACWDPALRAEPEGLIDPEVSLVSFWNDGKPVAVLSYYAVHPQSYYRTGVANPDFPGIARFMRQLAVPQALHVHFNGASGNVAAGKYNDGSLENRGILAERLAEGMKRAWEATKKFPVSASDLKWSAEPVLLPPARHLYQLQDKNLPADSLQVRSNAARLAWLRRFGAGKKIDMGCLSIGKIRIIHLPGEPFIEYQLAAKAERKDLMVAIAGYGNYGPSYIGTSIAYQQGGYESTASNVSAESEQVLMKAIWVLLNKD